MTTRIALFQPTSGIDPAANAAMLVAAIDEAAAGGAEMLFTPEMSGLVDRDQTRAAQSIASEADDRVLAAVREAAAKVGLWVHLGSLAVRRDDGRWANRGYVIDPAGGMRGRYDKIHLFDVDLPTGESWRESASYVGGGEAVVVEGTPVGALGLSICYDLRFPALYAALAEAGAEAVAIPAAFTVPTGEAHWQVLMRARAIENAVFVIAAAQAGHHQDGRDTYGHSLAVDPWGRVLVELDGGGGQLAMVEIDRSQVADVRRRIPVIDHRRPIPPARVEKGSGAP